jgi:hypothetical protein
LCLKHKNLSIAAITCGQIGYPLRAAKAQL